MAWNESDHPRVQAGNSEGGQFTSAARKAAGLDWEWSKRTVSMIENQWKKAGLPKDKLVFATSNHEVDIDGQVRQGMASYDPVTGEITIYPAFDMMTVFTEVDEETVYGVIQHEIAHGFFDKYTLDDRIYWNMHTEKYLGIDKDKDSRLSLLDSVRQSIQAALDAGNAKTVSTYATMYWNSMDDFQKSKALDETLAEVAKNIVTGKVTPPEWIKAFDLLRSYNLLYPDKLEGTAY